MMKELKTYIKNIKMDEENIKLKNTAATITIFAEMIKVLLCLIFMSKLNKTLVYITLIYSIISILLAIYILFNDNYKKISKYIFLDLSTFIFLLSNIIGGILIEKIIWASDKKIMKKMLKDESKIKTLPNKLHHEKKVYIYLFCSILIGYNYLTLNSIVFYILVLITLISFFIKDIIKSLKEFKKDFKSYITFILKSYITFIFISSCLFIIVGAIVGSTSTNELLLNERKIETFILGVFYAPIAEELLFRGCLRKLIKKDIIFILVSGISFGCWHVIGYDQSLLQYLYIIPYSVTGIGLAYVYAKTNNLASNISMHALNNLIASIPV